MVVTVTMGICVEVFCPLVTMAPGRTVEKNEGEVVGVAVFWLLLLLFGWVTLILVEEVLAVLLVRDCVEVLDVSKATPELAQQPFMGVKSSSQPSPQ